MVHDGLSRRHTETQTDTWRTVKRLALGLYVTLFAVHILHSEGPLQSDGHVSVTFSSMSHLDSRTCHTKLHRGDFQLFWERF